MAEEDSSAQPLYSSTFAPLLRQKAAGIWSRHQVIVAFVCASVFMVRMALLHAPFISVWTLLLVVVVGLDLLVIHGMSVWQILMLKLGLALRTATGKSRSTVSPVTAGATVAFVDIPGPDGDTVHPFRVVNTGLFDGACFIWDSVHNEATAVIRMFSDGSQLAGNDVKNVRASSFAKALNSMDDMADVVRVTWQSRSMPRPTAQDDLNGPEEADLVARDLASLEDGPLAMAMDHDYILTITVNPAKGDGKGNKVTAEDMSRILSERVASMTSMIADAGVSAGSMRWLRADQLRAQMKTLNDPEAYALLDATGGLPDDVPVQTSWREYGSMMSVGASYAKTYWIDKWPERNPVGADWLTQITNSPSVELVLTQAFHRRTEAQARNSLDSKGNESNFIARLNEVLKRPEDRTNVRERQLLLQQKDENVEDGGDIEFQGFITVISPSKERLHMDCRIMQASARRQHLHLDKQTDQQLARWVGALPLGLEGRR